MKVSLSLGWPISDERMKFYKQIGVENVDLYATSAFREGGPKSVSKAIEKVRSAGLEVPFTVGPSIVEFLRGQPGGEKQIEDFNSFIKLMGEESVPLVALSLGYGMRTPRPGYFKQVLRGGSTMQAFSVGLMQKQLKERDLTAPWAHHFTVKITKEEFMNNCIEAYKRLVPVAEDADVKLTSHHSDPPVPDWWGEGLVPGINNSTEIMRLFDAADSKNVGLHMCIGTRYESGEDIYKQIRIFGRRGKIFHTHFRNLRGTLLVTGGYEETSLDDGDMDMFRVLQALDRVGYDGCLNPDHYPPLIGDPNRYAAMAFAVGYIKALLLALPSQQRYI